MRDALDDEDGTMSEGICLETSSVYGWLYVLSGFDDDDDDTQTQPSMEGEYLGLQWRWDSVQYFDLCVLLYIDQTTDLPGFCEAWPGLDLHFEPNSGSTKQSSEQGNSRLKPGDRKSVV